MFRVLVIAVALFASAARVHADTVALLPLDGEKRFELYGQPIAAEIGRALEAHGVDVVVVGAKMNVPDRAQLIVDGTIKADKNNAITLAIRIRDPRGGTVLEMLPATAASLTVIDKAAAELSARIVPAVKNHLAALATTAQPAVVDARPPVDKRVMVDPPVTPRLPAVVTSVASPSAALPVLDFLARGLADELPRWSRQHKREARVVAAAAMSRAAAIGTTQSAGADVGVALEVLSFNVDPGEVPLGRARARVRIVHKGTILFERVIRTDTIVGDKGITEQEMAARTAREILAIVNAQLRRLVEGWR